MPLCHTHSGGCHNSTMITILVTKCVKNRTKTVYAWGSARFCFSTEENLLAVPRSFWRQFLAGINFLAHTGYSIFVLVRLLQYRYFNVNELDDRSQMLFESVCLFHL